MFNADLQKKRIHKNCCLKASFTVEACFIVPIIVIGIIALIWLVFYLRNVVKAEADADYFVFALEADAAYKKDGERHEEYSSNTNGAFYGAENAKTTIDRKKGNIEVALDIEHGLPKKGLLGYFVSKIRSIHIEKHDVCPDPSETARLIKAAGELTGSIQQLIKKK